MSFILLQVSELCGFHLQDLLCFPFNVMDDVFVLSILLLFSFPGTHIWDKSFVDEVTLSGYANVLQVVHHLRVIKMVIWIVIIMDFILQINELRGFHLQDLVCFPFNAMDDANRSRHTKWTLIAIRNLASLISWRFPTLDKWEPLWLGNLIIIIISM